MAEPPAPGDARFFARTGPHALAAVAAAAGAEAPDAPLMLSGVAPLAAAAPDQVSFIDNRRYRDVLANTRAGAVIVHPALAAHVPPGSIAILSKEPSLAWARVATLFHPPPPPRAGVHPSAVVDETARVDATAEIGPLTVIGAHAEIGPRCRIGPAAVIGDAVVLGPDCRVGAHACISHTIAGARVYVYPGARIGQEGFGFTPGPDGFVTMPQVGRVLLGDDVEIGANATIDRGALADTVIGAGSRLDNLVQIGHNVRLGRCCVIVAQVGISGSTELEDFVVVAAQAGLTGHLRIGARARVGAQAGVMADVAAAADVVGSPAQPVREFFRQVAILKKLAARRAQGAAEAPDPG